VRKIVSGELTLGAVLDEMVHILNDDKVVAAGEELVKHGENVLDAIEGVSGNAVVDEVMQIALKAGITKDSVMEGIESLDVNQLLVSFSVLQGVSSVRGCSKRRLKSFLIAFFVTGCCGERHDRRISSTKASIRFYGHGIGFYFAHSSVHASSPI
jgi:hypothetical protein